MLDPYKKDKVIKDLHYESICVECVEGHNIKNYNDGDDDDGFDLDGGVVICDPVFADLTNENFYSYLNNIHGILKQFSRKWSTIPEDFRHLLDSFIDIRQQTCEHFRPALNHHA
ncbi:hypothetical protein LIER_39710 [Lithospermum erythrorhizon]|uniref:Uncharacterized protein n=1 Tax=Lithospermum erythrorhizon TaxID=34254 RepID=A0AAV3QMS2_LITER